MSAAIQAPGIAQSERRAFEQLLERAIAPLMPVAIGYGMSANDVSFATRTVYLREMESRLKQERGHPISDARLALVTGLSRNEVARARTGTLRKAAAGGESAELLSRISVVLSTWHTNPKFAGAYGLPLDLDLEPSTDSPHRSFAELIETACADLLRPVTLDELIANGVAETVGGALVRCRARAAISQSNATAGKLGLLAQYSRFLATAAGTVSHNLLLEDVTDGYFDRLMISDVPLSVSTRRRFNARAMNSADALLSELDSWLSKNAGEAPGGSDRRCGLGIFFFEESRDPDIASTQGAPPQQA